MKAREETIEELQEDLKAIYKSWGNLPCEISMMGGGLTYKEQAEVENIADDYDEAFRTLEDVECRLRVLVNKLGGEKECQRAQRKSKRSR